MVLSFNILDDGFYNARLTPGTQYEVHQRNYADKGPGESLGSIRIETQARPPPPDSSTPIIAGVVAAFLVVAVIAAVFLYRRRRQNLQKYDDDDEGAIAMHHRTRSRIGSMMGKIRRGGHISGIGIKLSLIIFILRCVKLDAFMFNIHCLCVGY